MRSICQAASRPRLTKLCSLTVAAAGFRPLYPRHGMEGKAGLPTYLTRGDQTGGAGQLRPLSAVTDPAADAGLGEKQGAGLGQRHGILSKPQPGEEAPRDHTPLLSPATGEPVRDYSASETGGATPPSRIPSKDPTTFIGVADAQGGRDYMEDRHTLIPCFNVGASDGIHRQFVAVYDGHSSHRGSEHASRRLHEFIAQQEAVRACQGEPKSMAESNAMEDALKGAFAEVDDEIVEHAVKGGKRCGTTAVCTLRVGRVVYVAHAGDSRAVLCRGGRAVSLTKDHKPTVPEEAARIEAQGGVIDYGADRVHSNPEGQRQSRLNMSRALGDPDFKRPRQLVENEPDVARVVLKPGRDTFIVLGSDGIFDVMSNRDAIGVVRGALGKGTSGGGLSDTTAQMAAQALVDNALKLKTRDNVTAIVMLVDWES